MEEPFATDLAALARIDSVQKILEVVCRTTGLGFSAVARVTGDRWVACAVRDEIAFGLTPGGELDVKTTLCSEVRQHGQVVVIDDAASDPVYCGHPTPAKYGFRSYISVPIRLADGQFFGTLCAVDPRPAKVNNPGTVGMFTLFADLIATQLKAQERMAATAAALLDEQNAAVLREQFIAVLGHDLRNPLNAISTATEVLRRLPQVPDAVEMLGMIKRGSARMAGLINNLLDFARGRLGGGIDIKIAPGTAVGTHIAQVVDELRTAWPTRAIELEVSLPRPIACDGPRLGQMLSNLIANALAHGDPAGPVRVAARADAGGFEMSVSNCGATIPPHLLDSLFQPFYRAQGGEKGGPKQDGLGLGLYICSEIARAHGGTLGVESADGRTRFTFRMPVAVG